VKVLLDYHVTSQKMPEIGQYVIVAGGIATWDGTQWLSQTGGASGRPITWPIRWWMQLTAVHNSEPWNPPDAENLAPYRDIATPDLFEALRDLVAVVEEDLLMPPSLSYLRNAKAALAKAEGQVPG
jgi:hypothetical protein